MDGMQEQTMDEEAWKNHLLKSLEFDGSDKIYCKENGLNLNAFNKHKKKLGLTRSSSRRARRFVRVKTLPARPVVSKSPENPTELPDPSWVADVLWRLYSSK